MTTARKRLGTVCFGSAKLTRSNDQIVYFLVRLASLVGLALESSLSLNATEINQPPKREEDRIRDVAAAVELSQRTAVAYDALGKEQEELERTFQIRNALAAARLEVHEIFPIISPPLQVHEKSAGASHLVGSIKNVLDNKELDAANRPAEAALFVDEIRPNCLLNLETERLRILLEMSRAPTVGVDSKKLLYDVLSCVRQVLTQDCAYLRLYEAETRTIRIHALDFPQGQGLITPESATQLSECPAGIAFRARQTKTFNSKDLERIGSEFTMKMLSEGFRSVCCVPLITGGEALGALSIASKKDGGFGQAQIELLEQVAPQIATAIDNFNVRDEISALKGKLAKQTISLQQDIEGTFDLQEIVGTSRALEDVLEQVKTVAPSSATVLILGETGTGKELVARAVHKLSPRCNGNFIKLNCAAIPTGLLESELFGHEKGAFTGAISQKIGRLELAHKGTLFLDEVGEIPLELQPKLLRVLQDQEFERLGGTRTIRVDVRIVAATNRDVSKAVADHEFRSDLYYRLHVFPVRLPTLRQRPEDIPILVHYFVQKFAGRMNKKIENIPSETMHALEQWHWPGNIRELENFMERSVILTDGPSLRVPVGELRETLEHTRSDVRSGMRGSSGPQRTLEELEREYIVQVLRQSAGIVSGSHGAAARLGMKRTTLQSKMQRLGISRDEYAT
jgi:formate hydrogenlyase transcriptional activator